jgi:hypothetical protein
LIKSFPTWAEGCISEYRRTPFPSRSNREMLPNESKSNCIDMETSVTQAISAVGVGRVKIKLQGNRADRKENLNIKLRNASIRA